MIDRATIIGIVCLLIAANMEFKGFLTHRRPLKMLLCFVLAFVITVAGMKMILRSAGYVDNTITEQLVSHFVKKADTTKTYPANTLIIDGGSYTCRGIDGELLSDILTRSGYPTMVLQLSIAGGNHFERYTMHRRLLERLPQSSKEQLRNSRCLLMMETHRRYDYVPLAQFVENGITARTIDYLTPDNVIHGMRAWVDQMRHGIPDKDGLSLKTASDMVACSLINLFSVGRIQRLTPDMNVEARSGYFPLVKARNKFVYPGIEKALNELEKMHQAKQVEIPPWIPNVKERRLFDLYGPLLDDYGYFLPPNLQGNNLSYALTFSREYPDRVHILPDKALYRKLDDKSYWYDAGHMTKRGATLYTKWFARRIIDSGILVP